ncbi:unnamed protein product [Musa hybrid cultivar]
MYQCQLHSQRHRSLSDALFASSMEFETPTRRDTTPALDFCVPNQWTVCTQKLVDGRSVNCRRNKLCQAETKGAFDCTYPYLGEASVGYYWYHHKCRIVFADQDRFVRLFLRQLGRTKQNERKTTFQAGRVVPEAI